MTDEEVTNPVLAQVWQEHLRWKFDAAKNGTYDNSACVAQVVEDWARCSHCKDEVRRVNIEAGRRDSGLEWQEPPFVIDESD